MKIPFYGLCTLLSVFTLSLANNLTIHEFGIHLLPTDRVTTELNIYQALKRKPLQINTNYVAIPWAVLLNSNQLSILPDIKVNGGFTICQHVVFERILPILEKMGIDTLFNPHVPTGQSYGNIRVLPFPHYPVNGSGPSKNKDILYSFIGFGRTHPTRPIIFRMQHPRNCVIIERFGWFHEDSRQYKNVLSRSRFSLCPRGTGASTMRFWESLQAGAIPILISDEMTLPPIPSNNLTNWDKVIIRVAEKDVLQIPNIIAKISPEEEAIMRHNCLITHDLFFKDQTKYIDFMLQGNK